jgi:hypothetical protein
VSITMTIASKVSALEVADLKCESSGEGRTAASGWDSTVSERRICASEAESNMRWEGEMVSRAGRGARSEERRTRQ